ncbi:hypothetical protein ACFU44_00385 [Nocardia rhizosphaerihabitans]|uniref:hypothetical protein n=1 Tax=Nocardia rhizosphaerihabitans TaxID=1691570 RepID=UPI00366B9D3B
MPLATQVDVEAALGRELTAAETDRVNSLLDEASDIIAGYLHPKTYDPTPDPIRRVVARMVARVYQSPTDAIGVQGEQMSAGAFQVSHTFIPDSRTGGPWLSKADKIALRGYKFGAVSVKTW